MSATSPPSTRTIRRAVGLALAALVAVLLPVTAATGAPPSGSIRFDISDSTTVPVTPGSDGLVYVAAGQGFGVTLTFLDRKGQPTILSNAEDTPVTLTDGTDLAAIGTVAAGTSTASFAGLKIAQPATNVVLTATATLKQGSTVSDTSAPFDVLIDSKAVSGATSVGGDETGIAGDCNPTETAPVCGDLLPPVSGFADPGFLSQGCLTNTNCVQNSTFVQVLSKFNAAPEGSSPEPATLRMNCDKTLCGGGGIKKQQLKVTLTPGSAPVTAEACPAKGTVGPDQKFCVDYVQSTRDNAGDTILYLLFVEDLKVRFP